jgi:hypothetical protein
VNQKMASKSLIERLEEDVKELSPRIIDAIVEALEAESCKVVIDGFTARVYLSDFLVFSLWIANGKESIKSYDSQYSTVDLVIREEEQVRLWKALVPFMEKQRHQDFVFEPKKEEVAASGGSEDEIPF